MAWYSKSYHTVEGKNIGAPQNSEKKQNYVNKKKKKKKKRPKNRPESMFFNEIDAIDGERQEESKNNIKNTKKHHKTQKKYIYIYTAQKSSRINVFQRK